MNLNLQEGRKRYLEKLKSGEIIIEKRPSLKKGILAKCKDCMCDYVDGRLDCEVTTCSLYPWMPYGKLRKNRNADKKVM